MKRQILAFGDSLTWGLNPGAGRHRGEDLWTSVVEDILPDVHVIADALPGRTTCFDDWSDATDRNGARILPAVLDSHPKIDLVVILLGTNDLKPHLCGLAEGAAMGLERLVKITAGFSQREQAGPPKILVVSPPHCSRRVRGDLQPTRGRSIAESRKLAALYHDIAQRHGCGFFDAATVATASPFDGVHLEADQTRALGHGLAPILRNILGLP